MVKLTIEAETAEEAAEVFRCLRNGADAALDEIRRLGRNGEPEKAAMLLLETLGMGDAAFSEFLNVLMNTG